MILFQRVRTGQTRNSGIAACCGKLQWPIVILLEPAANAVDKIT